MDIDMRVLLHAKEYIDDLARGINPITKEEVDENDVINNIKISRCLLYVSDILNEAAQNGIPKRKASEKFDVQKIELEKFEYSSELQPISIIAQKINALKPERMTKLKTTALTGWLVDIGILNVVEINGKNHKRPTPSAENMGVLLEQRNGQYGPYYVVLYNEDAQHFIIDNLPAIIEAGYNESKKKPQ
ncbi:MAG: hypothetical protein IKN26_03035 [Eubacterium sp.]|nr:hypothetical protein [Eubacterium sp.]